MRELTISRFTPSLLTHEALEAIFVRREAMAERLVQSIRESATTGNKHFFLLHGPRGIGKTHIVSLVHGRVKEDTGLSERLRIAWLREEEWGVASYVDLLRSILRALHEEYNDEELAQANEALPKLTVEKAELEAEKLLLQSVGGRTLLIITENVDEIFAGLEEEGQKKLRALIQNNPVFTILATSRGLFNGVDQRESPFYGFFDIHALDEFTSEDATNLLSKIARQEGNPDLASMLRGRQGRARVRALHYLAGGNPRVYVIFSQFLTCESLDELVTAVMSTLDDLTAYYQERMAHLTPQQRKIVQFLCDWRGAPTVKVIAEGNFITHQTASSQLKKLRELGYARSEQRGRESFYELKEPLMRIALGVKKHRGEPLALLVEFLRLWHTHEELNRRLEMLKPEAALERVCLTQAMKAKKEEHEDPVVAACLRDYMAHVETEDCEAALRVADELIERRNYASDWMKRVACLRNLGREDDAAAAAQAALAIKPETAFQWIDLGAVLIDLSRHEEAFAACERAVEIDPDGANAWSGRGIALGCLERYEEALEACDKALEIEPGDARIWELCGSVLACLGRLEDSLAALDRCIQLSPNDAGSWSKRAEVLSSLGRHEEALAAFDKSFQLEPTAVGFHDLSNRAVVMMLLGQWDDGRKELDRALEHLVEENGVDRYAEFAIVRNMLVRTRETATWRKHIAVWVEMFKAHDVLSSLGQGLVRSIRTLSISWIDQNAARAWYDVWQDLAGGHEEMELPLRLLRAAVEYRAEEDDRVLLQLPIEERKLIERLLGIGDR